MAIALDDNTTERIKANGVEPIDERMWKTGTPACDIYFICGTPAALRETKPLDAAILTTADLVLFGLERLDDPPAALIKPFNLLYFKRADTLVDDDGNQLTSLDGMSGSPIFGAIRTPSGLSYWLLGIQSAVDRDIGRILIAFPFVHLGSHLENQQTAD